MFPIKKFESKFKNISSIEELQNFIKERSAHVTQTTLYGYLKTRIGTRYTAMFEDDVFVNSVNIAKWNIYLSALSDCTLYTFSYLIDQKNLKKNNSEEIFNFILESEKQNGLDLKLLENAKTDFKERIKNINWQTYYKEDPFIKSSLSLYKWSPIADDLKKLDKEIVLNSMKLKWNLIENEFKELTKNLIFK
tara:strand:- start:774 stop:1349 length:576 start_codon:yes stop_codon:yes gene_type:complete